MGIGDAITIVSFLISLLFAIPALLVFLTLVFRYTTAQGARRLEHGAVRPFVVGLIVLVIGGGFAANLVGLGSLMQFTGIWLYLFLLLAAFVGLAALANLLGTRISVNLTQNTGLQTGIGGLVLAFAFAFPFLGWFIVLPATLITGTGLTTLVLWQRFTARPAQPLSETSELEAQPS